MWNKVNKARRAVTPARSCPCIPRQRQYGDHSHVLFTWSLGNKGRKAGELLWMMFPAPQPENNEKAWQANPPEAKSSKQGSLSHSAGASGALLMSWSSGVSPRGFHTAPLCSFWLSSAGLSSASLLSWVGVPATIPFWASPLAPPVQHHGWFAVLSLSRSAPWPVATLREKWEGGQAGWQRDWVLRGLMSISSQREAKWLTIGGVAWVFILKPRGPVIMWVV